MNRKLPQDPVVIIPSNISQIPSARELSAAKILAIHFQTAVRCLPCSNHKTADFSINGNIWELKSPTGTGKYNIQHALKHALTQSPNVVIDGRFSKMHPTKLKNDLKRESEKSKSAKRVLLIEKSKKVVAIK